MDMFTLTIGTNGAYLFTPAGGGEPPPEFPLFVPMWDYTKSYTTADAAETITVVSRDSATQFTVASGKGAKLAAGGAVVVHNATSDRYSSHGIKTIAGDVITIIGALPAVVSTCSTMHNADGEQHLSPVGYKGVADFIVERIAKFGYKSNLFFAYDPFQSTTPAYDNPDVYDKATGTIKQFDVTLLNVAAGGVVSGTTDLLGYIQTLDANANIATSTPLGTYLPRYYTLNANGTGKGLEFSFDGEGKTGFLEIIVGAARAAHSAGSFTDGRVRLVVEADAVEIHNEVYPAGSVAFVYPEFETVTTFTVRMTCEDNVPTSGRLGGVFAYERAADASTDGFFADGDVVAFLGDSHTQYPPGVGPLRPDETASDGLQYMSERLRERLSDDGITVTTLNYGKSGTTSAWGLHWVNEIIDSDATHCVVCFGVNDHNSDTAGQGSADSGWDYDPDDMWSFQLQSLGGNKGAVTFAQWRSKLEAISDALIAGGVQPIILMTPYSGAVVQSALLQLDHLPLIVRGFEAMPAGGGGGPEPLVSIDFKNGVYSWGGTTHTLAETIEGSIDYDETWDPALVVADVGWRLTDTALLKRGGVLTTGAAAAILAEIATGVVVVVTYKAALAADTGMTLLIDILDLPAFAEGWRAGAGADVESTTVRLNDLGVVGDNWNVTPAATNKLAARLTPSALVISGDGGANNTAIGDPQDNASATHVALFAQITSEGNTATLITEKIEYYDPADVAAADLPGLST